MACSMAFFWAVEPSPLSVPVPQSAVLALPPALGELLEEAVVLLLEPQPARANVPTRDTPARLDIHDLEPLHSREEYGGYRCPPEMRILRLGDVTRGAR